MIWREIKKGVDSLRPANISNLFIKSIRILLLRHLRIRICHSGLSIR
jgi:hypothetical protein